MSKTSYLRAASELTQAALERHLQGMAEKLRSGENGKVREGIQQAIARTVVAVDGSLTIEAKSGGLLGLERNIARWDDGQVQPLLEPSTLFAGGRRWKIITVT